MAWAARAACIDVDLSLFFARRVEHGVDTRFRRYCTRCVVRDECLQTAVSNGFIGVWGNTTTAERRAMR
jgi:hypothetical protein